MRKAITDASVIYQMRAAGAVGALLSIPDLEVFVPDVVFERERQQDPFWNGLEELGLKIRATSHQENNSIASFIKSQKQNHPKRLFSKQEASCFLAAKGDKAIFLTASEKIKCFSTSKGVECHGSIWVLDEFERHGLMSYLDLFRCLSDMSRKEFLWLPAQLVAERLSRWEKQVPKAAE